MLATMYRIAVYVRLRYAIDKAIRTVNTFHLPNMHHLAPHADV